MLTQHTLSPISAAVTQSYVPTPKSYKPTRTTQHHMLLRQRLRQRDPTTVQNYKYAAFQHLLLQNVTCSADMFTDKGKKKSIDYLLNEDEPTWGCSLSNELGRLAQGIGEITGNNAIKFISKHAVPNGEKVAYANIVCDFRSLKKEKFRVRLTLGGDVLEYEGNASSLAASLLEAKLLLNSVISDSHLGAKFMSIDLKVFSYNPF